MKIEVGIEWDGPTGDMREWERRLEEIAPRQDRVTWLKMVWIPGDLFESERRELVVERWMIYQMYPLCLLEDMLDPFMYDLIVGDLYGKSPRLRGRYDYVAHRYYPDASCNVDLVQWRLFRETGCLGRPLWVVQGKSGGHKRHWRHEEKVVSQMMGGPEHPPIPGELSYAEPDWRTFHQLGQFNVMREAVDILAAFRKNPQAFDDEDIQQLEPIQGAVHAWLEDQVDAVDGEYGAVGSTFKITNPARTAGRSTTLEAPEYVSWERSRLVGITEE